MSMFVAKSKYLKTLKVSTDNSKLAIDDGESVHFLVTRIKQANYQRYCCNPFHFVSDPHSIINQYTDHNNDLYARVNLALAADSPVLNDLGSYIMDLHDSIIKTPYLDQGNLYRGVDLSSQELYHMESLHNFFIPSFTSASVEYNKAYDKNSLFVIKTSFGSPFCCTITPELSKFYSEEREILINCYSSYRLERVEKVNNQNILTLYLDEFI